MNLPTQHHLAQVNIARLLAPLDDPQLHGFVSRLDEINALADGTPGFVWRLQTDDGDATSLRVFPDSRILVNLSVWSSLQALQAFVYRSRHVELLRDRASWFDRLGEAHYAMWWIEAGRRPTVEEAAQRLAHLQRHGDTAEAFRFPSAFPAPSDPITVAASSPRS